MTDSEILALELGSKGYSCAQIIIIGTLRMLGEENELLIKSMGGLSQGIANTGQICGALAGAACMLSMYTAKGNDFEEAKKEEEMLLDELTNWFKEEFNHLTCDELLGISCSDNKECTNRVMDNIKCGAIVAKTFDKTLLLLSEYGIDPYEISTSS